MHPRFMVQVFPLLPESWVVEKEVVETTWDPECSAALLPDEQHPLSRQRGHRRARSSNRSAEGLKRRRS